MRCLLVLLSLLILLLWINPAIGAELSDPYHIMTNYYQAIGGLENLKKIKTSYSEGTTRLDGLKGKFRHWEQPPLRYRTVENYTTITQTSGDDGQVAWFLDTNEQLLIYKDAETLQRRKISRRLENYEHLDADSPYFTLTFGGVVTVLGKECYEIILTNSINNDISYFYIDTESFLLVQSRQKQPDMEIITRFGDYRQVGEVLISFYQYTRYLPIEKEEESQTLKYTINEPVREDKFALPKKKKGYRFLKGKKSSTVPFLFAENLIYIPVTIGDTELYWVLDSGASMSVIDGEYVKQLGLTARGSIKGYGFGDLFELGFVDIPKYSIGDIVFDLQTFFVVDNLTARSYEPEIAGIVGYDFLSRFVVEIDYDRRLLTFYEPESYQYNGPGVTINAPLKYRTFTVPVVLDGKITGKWSLDLGAHNSSVHYPFARQNKLLARRGIETISQGIAGINFEETVQFSCLSIGGLQLDKPLITIPTEQGKGATALGEIAGNLGNSILRHFKLVLNYPEQKIIVSRGKNFNTILPRDRSGMLIGRSTQNQPMVSFVANNSPAQIAGFVAGDIILAIDDTTLVPGQPVLPLRDLLRGEKDDSIIFAIKREGTIHNITIILADLFPRDTPACLATDNIANK